MKRLVLLVLVVVSVLMSGCYNQMVTSHESADKVQIGNGADTTASEVVTKEIPTVSIESVENDDIAHDVETVPDQNVTTEFESSDIVVMDSVEPEDVQQGIEEDGNLQDTVSTEVEPETIVVIDAEPETVHDESSATEIPEASDMPEVPEVYRVSLSVIGVDGAVLLETVVIESEAVSVFELLKTYCEMSGVHLDYQGSSDMVYIKGIQQLYEFDYGPLSGWMYAVDGVFPTKSIGGYQIDNDVEVILYYTKDSGKDIGAVGE